jgi:hypothetical protein
MAIAIPVAVDQIGFLSKILIRAQVAKIGALVNICNHCTIAPCICVTSFVSLVISDAIEKSLTFSIENHCTFS